MVATLRSGKLPSHVTGCSFTIKRFRDWQRIWVEFTDSTKNMVDFRDPVEVSLTNVVSGMED
jgi:hypothetical protein